MSTITDRALPDVRDGLKPSQRRILMAMHDSNLAPDPTPKMHKIAGDTSGNYHPHGEWWSIPRWSTWVRLKMRTMLVDKQGNFGSIDGDLGGHAIHRSPHDPSRGRDDDGLARHG